MSVPLGVMGVTVVLFELAGTDNVLLDVPVSEEVAELTVVVLLETALLNAELLTTDDELLFELFIDEPFIDELLVDKLLSGTLIAELSVSWDETSGALGRSGSERLPQPHNITAESAAESAILLMFLIFIRCFSPFLLFINIIIAYLADNFNSFCYIAETSLLTVISERQVLDSGSLKCYNIIAKSSTFCLLAVFPL